MSFIQKFKTKFVRYYPPLWFAGIRVSNSRADGILNYKVKLKSTFYNRGVRGTYFGGSAFSMVDPFSMLILMDYLGSDYIVWDKHSSIKFIKSSKKTLKAEVSLTRSELENIKSKVNEEGDFVPEFKILIHDTDSLLVAEVIKKVYIKRIRNEKS